MLGQKKGDSQKEVVSLSVDLNNSNSQTSPAVIKHDGEEHPLPKSNLLGLFDMCGEDDKCATVSKHQKDQQDAIDAMSSAKTQLSTVESPADQKKILLLSTNTAQLEGSKATNANSPTGVDELAAVVESSDDVADTKCPSVAEGDQEAAVIASALVKAAMALSSEAVAPAPELTVASSTLKDFSLHRLLAINLYQPCINRLAFYGILHDINKEAIEMAKEDGFHINLDKAADRTVVLIDEEEWLLTAVSSRNEEETQRTLQDQLSQSCVSSVYRLGGSDNFAYACGEKDSKEPPIVNEYGDNPNPVVAMNSGSRTQLWKPSRSWWEARSSKNPWIDPKNHVKRWRYLWPLIHYHKFLAKCVKKLKRHGFSDFLDPNASPIVSFLRCEICAVSNHLAACSKFTSEQWLDALEHFSGWNDVSSEAHELIRALVARQQKLETSCYPDARHLSSPLLRKVMESSGDITDQQLEKKEEAVLLSSSTKPKGRKPYSASSTNGNPTDTVLWQGYQMPYNQSMYGYYNPQMYRYPPEPQHIMGLPRYPNSNRRAPGAPHRGRGTKSTNMGGYANNNYPRYGMEQYGMGYYGSTMGVQYHHPQEFGMYPADYAGFGQVSLQGSASQPFDECSTVATAEEESFVRRTELTSSPVRNNMPESSPVAAFCSPQSQHLQISSNTHFLRSPPKSVPPSPFWNNFANQVVDYVCESPFVPRSGASHQQPQHQHHRMTPCHHLGGASATQQEGNMLFYNNFYQFSGVVGQQSPATQFVSSTSTAFFSGNINNNNAQPASVENTKSSSNSLALSTNS